MAQVMKYHNYPASGTGSISYTDSYSNSYSMDFGAFDWANMLDSYQSGSYTNAQAKAVAYLMKSCGYGVHMSYSPSESGAQNTYIPQALTTYFGYDQGIQYVSRDFYEIGKSYLAGLYYRNNNAWNQIGATDFTVLSLTTAIDEISYGSDREAPVYYDLQGNRIDKPQPGHVYIRKAGSSITKVLLR